jgi:Fe-Mn family superoxide dismutase
MFILPPLPYAYDALEPTVSADTFGFHHDKHHKAYVDTTNKMLADEGRNPESLEEVVKSASGKLFNQSGQAWNHGFFWESMTDSYAAPSGDLASAIETFGGLDALKTAFVNEGIGHFASGWVWIVADAGGALKVISTHDADTALVHEGTPVLVCDLWEHAYYLDYQNNRKGFLEAWFDKAANWAFAAGQLAAAKGQGQGYRYPAPVAG